jgi:hypothetical protein
MSGSYYVYEYFAEKDGIVNTSKGDLNIKKGDVYYVGKGINNRVSQGIRNMDCEKCKKEVGWKYQIVKDGLNEDAAFAYEKQTIEEYKNNGLPLTNKTNGNSTNIDKTTIANIKYLVKLVKSGAIKMSYENIALETESYSSLVFDLYTNENGANDKYKNIIPKCPDNINYIVEEYDSNKLTDRDIIFGNIAYVLNLLEQGMIKATQNQIADYFGVQDTVVSGIKKGKYAKEIPPIKPDNLGELLQLFDIGKLTDTEIKDGSIKYIIDKLIDTNILTMTIADLVRELGEKYSITYNWVQDLKRRKENVQYVKPSPDILANLFDKYHEIEFI